MRLGKAVLTGVGRSELGSQLVVEADEAGQEMGYEDMAGHISVLHGMVVAQILSGCGEAMSGARRWG